MDLEGVLSTDLGLVFKAHRLVYHSTLGLRVIKKCECRGRRAWIWKGCSRSWLPGLPLATSRSSTCCPCATGYTCVTRVTTCVTRLPTTVCNPSGDSCRVCHWRHPGLSPLSFSYGVAYHRPYGSYRPGSAIGDIQVQLLHRNVQRFRGVLVFKAHKLLRHSTLGVRVIKKKKKSRPKPPSFCTRKGVEGRESQTVVTT